MTARSTILQLLFGLATGIALGLIIAWLIFPVQFVDTAPSSLRADFKDQQRLTIAAAYAATGNLGRASARLSLLGDSDPAQALNEQATRSGNSDRQVLEKFAQDLENPRTDGATLNTPININSPVAAPTNLPPPTDIPTEATPIRPTTTATPRPTIVGVTIVPHSTRMPTATPGAPFELISADTLCSPDLPSALLQVIVRDAKGQPAAGIQIDISWNSGQDMFFTGLKPELGNGYADFQLTPGVVYTLRLAAGGTSVTDLTAPACTGKDAQEFNGSLRLIFQQK